jgi:hypothetical protein
MCTLESWGPSIPVNKSKTRQSDLGWPSAFWSRCCQLSRQLNILTSSWQRSCSVTIVLILSKLACHQDGSGCNSTLSPKHNGMVQGIVEAFWAEMGTWNHKDLAAMPVAPSAEERSETVSCAGGKEKNRRGMLGRSYNSARDVHRRDEELLSYVLPAVLLRQRKRRQGWCEYACLAVWCKPCLSSLDKVTGSKKQSKPDRWRIPEVWWYLKAQSWVASFILQKWLLNTICICL